MESFATVTAKGAREAADAFRAAIGDLERGLPPLFVAAATDMEAQVRSRGRTRQAREALDSLATSATGDSATLVYGGTPWAMGAEFGSDRYRQFPAFRRSGHFVMPGVHSAAKRQDAALDALAQRFVERASK